jgi:hypothetical protein
MSARLPSSAIAGLIIACGCAAQVLTVGPGGKNQISSLTEKQKATLLTALQDATGEDRPDLLREYTVFPEPLAKQGPPAIIAISSHMGANADSSYLIFRQQGDSDVPILDSVAGDYDLRDSRHHGYLDIVLTNYQGVHWIVSVWQFDGQQYRVSKCTEKSTDGTQKERPASQCG